jgi:hypothetical protein
MTNPMSYPVTAPADLGAARRLLVGAITLLMLATGTVAWMHTDRPQSATMERI